jgi:hypothetical protein
MCRMSAARRKQVVANVAKLLLHDIVDVIPLSPLGLLTSTSKVCVCVCVLYIYIYIYIYVCVCVVVSCVCASNCSGGVPLLGFVG